MEQESEGQIAFIDVLVKRSENHMSTSVYCKKTHPDGYLNFRSHHHPKVLLVVVKCLRNRAINICDQSSKDREIQHLCDTFQVNGFPTKVIDTILRKKPIQSQPQPNNPPAL